MEIRKPTDGEHNQILNLCEDQFHDIKSARIKPAALQTHFVAFANTDGGEIYVGVEDTRTAGERLIGFSTIEAANEAVKACLTTTTPSVEDVDTEFIDFGTKGFVLHFIIPKSPKVHFASDKNAYIRVNASTRKLEGEKVTQLAYAKGAYQYERVAVQGAELDALVSSPFLADYMKRIQTEQGPEVFVKKQKLVTKVDSDFVPNVAGILLFDEDPQATLGTRCAIKVYRLQTKDIEYKREYLKEIPQTITGPAEIQVKKVIDEVNRLLFNASYNEGGKLVKLRYPAEALKEILVNAVIHRDYSLNDDIHIRIFDNRIEIQSPGKLPGYMSVQNLLTERYSRNPNIVRMLHNLPNPMNMDIGEGLNTVYNALQKAGLVPPTITELENAVLVTIKHQSIASAEDLIMEYLETHDEVTNKIVRELTGEDSENKSKKVLQKLRREGKIELIGNPKASFDYKYKKAGPNVFAVVAEKPSVPPDDIKKRTQGELF